MTSPPPPTRQLRRQLEAANAENAQLRRKLVEVRAENRRLRAARSMPAHRSGVEHLERSARIRVMLSDPHSRNP